MNPKQQLLCRLEMKICRRMYMYKIRDTNKKKTVHQKRKLVRVPIRISCSKCISFSSSIKINNYCGFSFTGLRKNNKIC